MFPFKVWLQDFFFVQLALWIWVGALKFEL